jgi:hypothetical protein
MWAASTPAGVVTVHVAADTVTIDLASDDIHTVRRTTPGGPQHQGQQPRKAAHVSRAIWKACVGTDPSILGGTRQDGHARSFL